MSAPAASHHQVISTRDVLRDLSRTMGRSYVRAEVDTRRHLPLPDLPRTRTMPGSVWGVSVVRNEIDVLPGTIDHLLAQGLTGLIVADMGSTDGTREYLQDVASSTPGVHVVDDTSRAFHQGQKLTRLSHFARSQGADWILPFDADEHCMAPGMSVAEFLGRSDADIVVAHLHNVFPMLDADGQVVLERVDTQVHRDPKVAFRVAPGTVLLAGNHHVIRPGLLADGLFVAHFPWRTREQVMRKVRTGAAALKAAGVDAGVGTHWQMMATQNDAELGRVWTDLLEGRGSDMLSWAPHGPFVRARAAQWRTWDPDHVLAESLVEPVAEAS